MTGPVIANGGTMKLLNYGATPQIGDTFAIFNQPITGSLTILSPAFTVTNNLAVDGTAQTVSANIERVGSQLNSLRLCQIATEAVPVPNPIPVEL